MTSFLNQFICKQNINSDCKYAAHKIFMQVFTFLLLFLLLNKCNSGSVGVTKVPGQNHMMTEYYLFDNSLATGPAGLKTSFYNITFVNGFGGPTGVSNYYSAYLSLVGLDIQLDDELNRYIQLYSTNRWYDKAEFGIDIQPQQKIISLTIMMLFVDPLYPAYLFSTDLIISIGSNVSPTQLYTNIYPFSFSLYNYAAPNLKLLPMLNKLKFNVIAANDHGFQYSPTFTILNNTHLKFSINNLYEEYYLSQVRISLLVIQMNQAPYYIRFVDTYLNHTFGDGLLQINYTGNANLISRYAILGGLLQVSNHLDQNGTNITNLTNLSNTSYLYFVTTQSDNTYIKLQWTQARYISLNILLFFNVYCQTDHPFYHYIDGLCYDICPVGYIENKQNNTCRLDIQYCNYSNANECWVCFQSFLISADSLSCFCSNGTYITTGVCNNISGCLTVKIDSGFPVCIFCDVAKDYVLVNNGCVCKSGFYFSNSTNSNISQCVQNCGDGKLYHLQCDDGNTKDGDGCSSSCTLQSNFSCYLDQSLKTICRYEEDIQLLLSSIMKVDYQNAAILTFNINNNYLPFPLNLKVEDVHLIGLIGVSIRKIQFERGSLKITIDYSHTIEGNIASFEFNFSQSSYISQNSVITIQTSGDNVALIYCSFLQTLTFIRYGSIFISCLSLLIAIVSLPLPKFIGVETAEIIQLFYFSLLLIYPITSWSPIYQSLTLLKYTNGYNAKIKSSDVYNTKIVFFKKFLLLGLDHNFLNNNNITIGILFIMVIVFGTFLMKKKKLQEKIFSLDKIQRKNFQEKQAYFGHLLTMEKIYKLVFHFCMFVFLQIIASIVIATGPYVQTFSQQLNYFQIIEIFFLTLTLMIVTLFLLNNFINILLTNLKMKKLKYRYQNEQRLHVRVNIIYLVIISILIFMFNQKEVFGVPMSVFVFFLQFIYIIILIKINPYRFSLTLHKFTLIFDHVCFLIYLGLICYNNIFSPAQTQQILISYFALISSAIIFVLAMARIYYQYRYGNELDEIIKKKIEAKENSQREDIQLKFQLNKYQNSIKQKTNKFIIPNKIYTDDNQYLYENQQKEQQKQDLINWLNNRINWSEKQKDEYYFQHFSQKPLIWLQVHDPQKYEKIKQSRKKLEKQYKKGKNQKQINQDQQRLTEYKEQLRRELMHKKIAKRNN